METAQATIQAGTNSHNRWRFDQNFNADAPRNRSWKGKQRLKISHHHYHIHGDYALSDVRVQQTSTPPPSFMYLMKYEVPVVLFLLTLKYQGNLNIIFNENPVPLLCFIAATFFYSLTVGAMKQMTTLNRKWIPALIHVARASVLVSAVSLISIFLPYPISLLPVAVFISYPVALTLLFAFPLVLEYVVKKIHDLSVWARGGCTSTMEASSPV